MCFNSCVDTGQPGSVQVISSRIVPESGTSVTCWRTNEVLGLLLAGKELERRLKASEERLNV